MNRFAALVARLETAGGADARAALIADYLNETPEPDRSIAQSLLRRTLKPRVVKLALVRGLAEARIDPVLFGLAQNYVGDIGETIALVWPPQRRANRDPSLSEIVEALSALGRSELPKRIENWLDACDETGRWALIKLITGTLRIGGGSSDGESSGENLQSDLFPSRPKGDRAGAILAILLYGERTNPRARISPLRCTFGVWDGDNLAPIGRCEADGADAEFIEEFIAGNAKARFGPVREVRHDREIALVAELSFAGIIRSPRRKAGLTLRALRLVKVLPDAKPSDAGTLAVLEALAGPA